MPLRSLKRACGRRSTRPSLKVINEASYKQHLSIVGHALHQGFVGDYDWANVMLPNCSSVRMPLGRTHTHYAQPRRDMSVCRWATTTLREICHDRAHYVSTECSEQTMRNAYKQARRACTCAAGTMQAH
eukprot:5384000-Pleurochrysis_carterae.AAC.8